MKKIPYILLIIPFFLGLVSCGAKKIKPNELTKWIADKDNGLYKETTVKDLVFKVKYIPNSYLVLKDAKSNGIEVSKNNYDSLLLSYQNSYTFLFTISTTEKGKDILYKGLNTKEELEERIKIFNFRSQELFLLEFKGQKINPVLCNMQNTYSLNTDRTFYMVFTEPDKDTPCISDAESWVFEFDDIFFNTGKNRFSFTKKDIDNIPTIDL